MSVGMLVFAVNYKISYLLSCLGMMEPSLLIQHESKDSVQGIILLYIISLTPLLKLNMSIPSAG